MATDRRTVADSDRATVLHNPCDTDSMRQMAACALAGRGLIDALERVLSTLLTESTEAERLEFIMLAHSASADIERWWENRT